MDGFTKKQVTKITGLSLRSVQYYTERGLVTPEVDAGEGRGKARRYSRQNLIEFSIIKALSRYGMAFAELKKMLVLLLDSIYSLKVEMTPKAWLYLCDYGYLVAFIGKSGGMTVDVAYLDFNVQPSQETPMRNYGIPIFFNKFLIDQNESMMLIRMKDTILKAEEA